MTPDQEHTVDALADGVVIADGQGDVQVVNAAAASMLDTTPAEATGRPLADVLQLLDQSGRTWVDENAPYAGLHIRTGIPEQSWLLPNGLEVLTTARIQRDDGHGPITRVAVSLRSGRGRARLDRERSDLVATVAHELRSPLSGVKGFVQALLNRWDKLNDDQKKLMLSTVYSDSERLTRLITELLAVARIDTGRLSLFPRPSSVPALVARSVESVAAGTSRPIDFVHEDGLPEIFVDQDRFTQVVTNLLENGVLHGEGTVRVTASRLPVGFDHDGVLLVVEDEGAGIPQSIRDRVFTKFWRHGARGGSGLGMYIVHGLTRAHGGSVEIGDRPGGGARISLVWPADDRRPK